MKLKMKMQPEITMGMEMMMEMKIKTRTNMKLKMIQPMRSVKSFAAKSRSLNYGNKLDCIECQYLKA